MDVFDTSVFDTIATGASDADTNVFEETIFRSFETGQFDITKDHTSFRAPGSMTDTESKILGVLDLNADIISYKHDPDKHKISVEAYAESSYMNCVIKLSLHHGDCYVTVKRGCGRTLDHCMVLKFQDALQKALQTTPFVIDPKSLMWAPLSLSDSFVKEFPSPPRDVIIRTIESIIKMLAGTTDDLVFNGCTSLSLVFANQNTVDVIMSSGFGPSLFGHLYDIAFCKSMKFSPATQTFAAMGLYKMVELSFVRKDIPLWRLLDTLTIAEFVEKLTIICAHRISHIQSHSSLHLRRQCGLILYRLVKDMVDMDDDGELRDWIIGTLMMVDHVDHNHQPLTSIVDEILSHLISVSSDEFLRQPSVLVPVCE
jgi:hypothetical protein